MDKSIEAAMLHFGPIEGNISFALTSPNNGFGEPGGFTVNGVSIHPQNCKEGPVRRKIIIDHDTEYPLMLIRVIEIDS